MDTRLVVTAWACGGAFLLALVLLSFTGLWGAIARFVAWWGEEYRACVKECE
jgi:hypothetical protein